MCFVDPVIETLGSKSNRTTRRGTARDERASGGGWLSIAAEARRSSGQITWSAKPAPGSSARNAHAFRGPAGMGSMMGPTLGADHLVGTARGRCSAPARTEAFKTQKWPATGTFTITARGRRHICPHVSSQAYTSTLPFETIMRSCRLLRLRSGRRRTISSATKEVVRRNPVCGVDMCGDSNTRPLGQSKISDEAGGRRKLSGSRRMPFLIATRPVDFRIKRWL